MNAGRRLHAQGSVVAIGVFDGVHRAHRRIIEYAVRRARAARLKCIVLTFWPHPAGEQSLYSLQHRRRIIAELGVDRCVVVRFTRRFASLNPESFIRDILVKELHARLVCVGENFRFGRSAAGTTATLRRYAGRWGYAVRVFGVMKHRGRTISSTAIRSLIAVGRIAEAGRLLGRPVSVFGTVVRGDSRGRGLGFPTANIDPHHEILPPPGVYAVRVALGTRGTAGICYIGTRPTFKGRSQRISVEVHLFGFSGDLYGRDLELFFVRRIRGDKKFPSVQALVERMRRDSLLAKRLLSRHQ